MESRLLQFFRDACAASELNYRRTSLNRSVRQVGGAVYRAIREGVASHEAVRGTRINVFYGTVLAAPAIRYRTTVTLTTVTV